MVRVIAELSVHTPTASSTDRYKYRYGCGGSVSNGRQQFVYKRPALSLGENMTPKQSEKQPLLINDDTGDIVNINSCGSSIINKHIDTINETNIRINAMVEMRRNARETQQMREIIEKSEKEKERQKEEDLKKATEKEINHKLGKIIYRSRSGKLFEAHHSVQMTICFVLDKKTGQSIRTQTQKVVWNDKVFETKQDWFSEMAKSSANQDDDNMKIVHSD
jgi:uncharacterized FlaG/YvyC family protein